VDNDAGTGTGWDQRLLLKGLPDPSAQIQTLEPIRVELAKRRLPLLWVLNLVEPVALSAEAQHLSGLGSPKDGLLKEAGVPVNGEPFQFWILDFGFSIGGNS
jgi:hypothetical protein